MSSWQDNEIHVEEPVVSKPNQDAGSTRKRKEKPEGSEQIPVKKTRSKVWNHYTRLKSNPNKCTCNYCGKELSCATTSGTTNLKNHLKRCNNYTSWAQRESQQNLNSGTGVNSGTMQLGRVTQAVCREASNEMLVLGQLPLSFIESLAWKHFCKRVQLPKPHCRRTATKDIVELYVRQKASLKKMFLASKQRVSLTTDIWVSSTTGASCMVITGHFIDACWKLRKLYLGFKHVLDHKGSTIVAVLLDCLAEWGIERVFTITVDNATANTNALQKFSEKFKELGTNSLLLSGELMHVRCAAHILNLIVKDGMKGIKDSVGAIRNAVVYVRASGARLESFGQKLDSDSARAKEMENSVCGVMMRLFEEYSSIASIGSSASSTQPGTDSQGQVHSTSHVENVVDEFVETNVLVGVEKLASVYSRMVNDEGFDATATELDMYLKENVEPQKSNTFGQEFDILSWWRVNAPKYPILSEMAKDILSMQVSSVASESAFSISGQILEPHRSCLTHYMIEVLMCVEQWMKADHNFGENGLESITQIISDIEDLDNLEKEFELGVHV